MTSKRSRGIETPKRAVARAARRSAAAAVAAVPAGNPDPTPKASHEKKTLTGRAATRAAKRGTGHEKPWRSRMQRARRRPRTGGWN